MINCKSLAKMALKIETPDKGLLWQISHYYLCIKNGNNEKDFFICTSNPLRILMMDSLDNIVTINPNIYKNTPFTKPTHIFTKEIFKLKNILVPINSITKPIDEDIWNIILSKKCLNKRQYIIDKTINVKFYDISTQNIAAVAQA